MIGSEIINLNKMSDEEIMIAIGQDKGSNVGPSVPRLGLNRSPEDDFGNRLPLGSYFVYDPSIGGNVYGIPITFRPFLSQMQYMHFDPDKNEYVNRSVIVKNWNDEAIDLQGGTKCSKVSRKEVKDLPPEQQAIQKLIRCYQLVYGLVSFDGKKANGESHSLKNFPVIWRVTGTGFRPVQEAVEETKQAKKLLYKCSFTLTSTKQKTGSNVYYVPDIDVNSSANLSMSKDDEATFAVFLEIIKSENDEIVSLWKAAKAKKPTSRDGDTATIIKDIEADPIEILSK
jgi:hypothetical protein|tara:strand:+ start:4604 stop:5458 length:855 start_codon:yes stop_codon:yes gene_type:complete